MKKFAEKALIMSLFVGVMLPWAANHPWSHAILYRKLPNVRTINCAPLRCMDGSYYPTCNAYGQPLAYIQSPCRGH